MLSDCLKDLIGIRGECSEVDPSSNLFIDDLINIDVDKAEKAMSGGKDNGFEYIKMRINEAGLTVAKEIEAHYNEKFRRETIIENETIGFFLDNLQKLPAVAGKERGIQVETDWRTDNFEFFLHDITLQMQLSGDVVVNVYDLISNTILDTITVTAVANKPTQKIVNRTYKSSRQKLNLAILYDSSNAAFESNIISNLQGCTNCGHRRNHCFRNKYIEARGVEIGSGDQKIDTNITSTGDTAGMSINYSLNCDIEPFICSQLSVLAWPIRLKAASDIMREAQHSARINTFVLAHEKDHEALADKYEEEYKGYLFGFFTEKGRQLKKGVIEKLALPRSICWQCKPRLNNRVVLPG